VSRKAAPCRSDGNIEELRAPLVISSIGSIPEPIAGIAQDGALYRYADAAIGRLEGYDNVFCVGNVITGKGNIIASRRHSIEVSEKLINSYLGLDGEDHAREDELWDPTAEKAGAEAEQIAGFVESLPTGSAPKVEAVLERVRQRQKAVGYEGSYRDWIRTVTPIDLA